MSAKCPYPCPVHYVAPRPSLTARELRHHAEECFKMAERPGPQKERDAWSCAGQTYNHWADAKEARLAELAVAA
jgi:hypothetical protein